MADLGGAFGALAKGDDALAIVPPHPPPISTTPFPLLLVHHALPNTAAPSTPKFILTMELPARSNVAGGVGLAGAWRAGRQCRRCGWAPDAGPRRAAAACALRVCHGCGLPTARPWTAVAGVVLVASGHALDARTAVAKIRAAAGWPRRARLTNAC